VLYKYNYIIYSKCTNQDEGPYAALSNIRVSKIQKKVVFMSEELQLYSEFENQFSVFFDVKFEKMMQYESTNHPHIFHPVLRNSEAAVRA
jgi:hypothetical protein